MFWIYNFKNWIQEVTWGTELPQVYTEYVTNLFNLDLKKKIVSGRNKKVSKIE